MFAPSSARPFNMQPTAGAVPLLLTFKQRQSCCDCDLPSPSRGCASLSRTVCSCTGLVQAWQLWFSCPSCCARLWTPTAWGGRWQSLLHKRRWETNQLLPPDAYNQHFLPKMADLWKNIVNNHDKSTFGSWIFGCQLPSAKVTGAPSALAGASLASQVCVREVVAHQLGSQRSKLKTWMRRIQPFSPLSLYGWAFSLRNQGLHQFLMAPLNNGLSNLVNHMFFQDFNACKGNFT